MTTITFGGGPTIEARKKFSNLKDGSQVPGYGGYIHQIKYTNGHTYGEQTSLLSRRNGPMSRARSAGPGDILTSSSADFDVRPLAHALPKTNGGNRLTESMVPGYTGYIPSRKFRFSDTYKKECDGSIDQFLSNKEGKYEKDTSLVKTVSGQPKHTQTASSSEVKHILDSYADNHPTAINLQSDKREFEEPPVPGYTGHIPRIVPTSIGLGARYHETTRKGLATFKSDFSRYSADQRHSKSVSYFDDPTGGQQDQQLEGTNYQNAPGSKKIYVKPGMIPKYTGYVHGRKFDFGSTYGNSTRDLPICNHTQENFGVYLEKNPPKTATC